MKSTGIIWPVDTFGRIALSKELRSILNITEKDSLEIFAGDSAIILKKHQPSCIFCGSMGRTPKYRDHNVHHECMEWLVRRLEEEPD